MNNHTQDELMQVLFDLVMAGDHGGAVNLVDSWAKDNGYERAMIELVDPTIRLIGKEWAERRASLAQSYIAAKIAQDVMEKAAVSRSHKAAIQATKGPIVIGNIEDDYHALGRKLVVTFLQLSGWEVHDLGNDVPPTVYVDKAAEVDARVIGSSAMMYTTAMNIKRLRVEIDKRGLTGQIKLAVGGAVFNERPELVQEVGGDGTARNAINAPELMDRLWAEALKVRK